MFKQIKKKYKWLSFIFFLYSYLLFLSFLRIFLLTSIFLSLSLLSLLLWCCRFFFFSSKRAENELSRCLKPLFVQNTTFNNNKNHSFLAQSCMDLPTVACRITLVSVSLAVHVSLLYDHSSESIYMWYQNLLLIASLFGRNTLIYICFIPMEKKTWDIYINNKLDFISYTVSSSWHILSKWCIVIISIIWLTRHSVCFFSRSKHRNYGKMN